MIIVITDGKYPAIKRKNMDDNSIFFKVEISIGSRHDGLIVDPVY